MANFDFPSSPSNGQSYSANGITYTYNGTVWKRETGATKGIKGEPSTVAGDKGQKGEIGATGGAGSSVPSGGIILWSGAANAIPTGWYLCNGSNGTPDLRGRFVVGYSNTDGLFDVNDTGGTKDATVLVQHSHELPKIRLNPGNDSTIAITLGSGQSYQIGYSSSAMSTNIDTGNRSSGSATNANLPPYYALCYIMKS